MANERKDDRTLSREELIKREERPGEQREKGLERDLDPAQSRSGGGRAEDLTEPAGDDDRHSERKGRIDPGAQGQRQVRPPENDEDFNIPADGGPET